MEEECLYYLFDKEKGRLEEYSAKDGKGKPRYEYLQKRRCPAPLREGKIDEIYFDKPGVGGPVVGMERVKRPKRNILVRLL